MRKHKGKGHPELYSALYNIISNAIKIIMFILYIWDTKK